MKKLRFFFLVITLITLSLPAAFSYAAQSEDVSYVATVFNERNGLPTGEANDVLQTSDGYIWVGSYGGLIRYDGTNFRNFSTEGILTSSSVRTMYEDAAGRLWIGTNDAGVFLYEKDRITRPKGQPEDTFLCVRGFAEDKDGVIYACSNSGIAEIRDGDMKVYDAPELKGLTIYSVAVDEFGRVWCADSTGGCRGFKGGKEVHYFSGKEIFGKGGSVYSVVSGKDGEIWIGSSGNKVARLSFATEGFSGNDRSVKYFSTGEVSTHNNLRVMRGGEIMISGQRGLGVLYEDGSLREFGEREGADSINNACTDYEGNIWIASSNKGIVRLSKGCYTSPNYELGIEGITVNAVAMQDGVSYIGTDSGLMICDKKHRHRKNELTRMYGGENKIRIRDIISDSKGQIWIAAYDMPVVCYEPESNKIRVYKKEDGLCSDRARVLLELSDGRIAVGTQDGVSIISEKGVDASYTDMAYPMILSLLEKEDGSLLAGSDGGGIYELKDGNVINHDFTEGLTEGVVLRMLRDSEGDGYFISAGSSLYYWENDSFRKLDGIEKEPGSIFDFYQSGDTLWLLQNNGILASSRKNLMEGGTGEPITYSFAHGLTGSLNANTWHCLYGGKLYLATRNGISVFDFSAPEYILPKLIINSVNIDDKVYEHPEKLEIPSTAQRVTIDFAALSHTGIAPVSVAYRLEGFEDKEIVLDGEKSGSVSYTNLRGGNYVFRLRVFGRDNAGKENAIRFEMEKEKHLYEYPLFWIIAAVVLIVVVAGTVLLIAGMRIRTAQKRQQEYRDILEQSLLTFAGTIDAKDTYTNGHSTRVAQYSRELAGRLGFSDEEQERIYYVALLHDIGKIGIPDDILNKPGKLTPEEMDVIRTHPNIGADILKNFTALDGIAEGAKYHHERYDGNGYSEGRAGEDIPLVARIICIADTYDAMSSERCYRKPLPREKILSEFEKGMGSQFDPDIVLHMIDMIKEDIVPFK